MLIKVFRKREILTEDDEATLTRTALSLRPPVAQRSPQHRRHLAIARRGLPVPRRQSRRPADPGQPRLLRRRPLRRQEARPAEPAAAAPDRPPIRLARRGSARRPAVRQVRRPHHDDAVRRHAGLQRERQRAVVDDEARLAAVRRQTRTRRGKIGGELDGRRGRRHGAARRRCSTTSPPRSPPAASARCSDRRRD